MVRLTQAPGIFLTFSSMARFSPPLAMGRCHTQNVILSTEKEGKMQRYPREGGKWQDIPLAGHQVRSANTALSQHICPLPFAVGGTVFLRRCLISLRPWVWDGENAVLYNLQYIKLAPQLEIPRD